MKLKKLLNQKEMNKVAKTALAMVLAGSFTFSSSVAFANETTTTEENNVEAVQVEDNTIADNTVVAPTTDVQTDVEVDEPTLVPGDIFYFAKLALEKIQLILTMDDVKEAELFAKFASERLAEAEKLIAEGKEDAAVETIQIALEEMSKSDSALEETNGTEDATTVEGEESEVTEDTAVTEEEVTTDATVTVEAPINEDEEAVEGVKEILTQNMISLQANMLKVKNPVAKAALQRNFEKSKIKLAKKLAKLEALLAEEAEEVEGTEEQVTNDADTTVETDTQVETDTTEATDTDTDAATDTDVTEDSTTTVAPSVKEVKAAAKQERKAAKQEAKNQKAAVKETRKEAKNEVKASKNSAKTNHGKGQKEEKGHK